MSRWASWASNPLGGTQCLRWVRLPSAPAIYINDVCPFGQVMGSFADDVACGNEVTCGKWRLLNTSEIKANEKIRKY